MKLGQLLHEALCEKYLGRTIDSDFGDCFVVEEIVVQNGSYGDPPIEILFHSKEYIEAGQVYREWHHKNNPAGLISAPPEIEGTFRNACRNGSCCLTDFNDDLPEL